MEFKKVKLGEISEITKLAGFEFSKYVKYVDDGEIIALRALNIKNNMLKLDEIKRINKEVSESLIRSKLYKNDIILTYTGNGYGAAAMIKEDNKFHLAPNIAKITPKDCNPYFLFKYITSSKFQKIIANNIGGSSQPTIPMKVLRILPIEIPNIEIQDKVAKILYNIDKKIELNNQMNDNLHEILKLLYNTWFIKNSQWKKEKLKNYADCILGGTPSRNKHEYWNGDIDWINSGEVNNFRILKASEKITNLGLKKSSTTLLPIGTTVLAITGATLGQVSRLEIETCTNQSVVGVIANNYLSNEYIYLSILSNISEIVKSQTGGAQQHINKGNVEEFKILVPNENIIKKFDLMIKPIFNRIRKSCFENQNLEQLRDALLPKLINGEINLDKIDI